MRLDASTVNAISTSMNLMGEPRLVSEVHAAAARASVRVLFEENVDDVFVNIGRSNQREDVEGFYLSCDVDEGQIFVPKRFPTPAELIAHELGHAVHHMFRRRAHPTNPAFWAGGPVEGELSAYYTQINYLLKHGTKTEFYQALGALSYFAAQLAVVRATRSKLSLEDFLGSEEFAPYAGAPTRDFVVRMFCSLDSTADPKGERFRSLCSSFPSGFGFALALKLVDERESMRTFMAEDSCSASLSEKLTKAFPHRGDLDDLDDLPEVIANLAARFIASGVQSQRV
jgi:hypothetical protein